MQAVNNKAEGGEMKETAKVPTAKEVDETTESGANPNTLCANWRRGCNGVTDGADTRGKLTYCDECRAVYK